jgi:Cu(I)/Ag(I) efflux system membrane fusion protein
MMSVRETGSEAKSGRVGDGENGGVELEGSLLPELLPHYFALHAALSGDDFEAAQVALKSMMGVTGHTGSVSELIHAMLATSDLDGMRRPHFETLSNAIIMAVRAEPTAFKNKLYIMHCPMVYGDHGANWLQADDKLLNPYFGATMLKCGETIERVGELERGKTGDGEDAR